MASKWFSQGNVSSDEDDVVEDNDRVDRNKAKIRNMAADFEQGGKKDNRVVLNQKEKKWSALKEICNKIKEKIKINDFVELLRQFQLLNKEFEKLIKLFEAEGYPSFLARAIVNLIEHCDTFQDKKSLNITNSKAFNTLGQKLKKFAKEYANQIIKFKAIAQTQQEEKQEESDEVDSLDQADDDEQLDEDDRSPLDSSDPMVRRKYWLKKKFDTDQQEEDKKEDKKDQKKDDKKDDRKDDKKLEENKQMNRKANLIQKKEKVAKYSREEARNKLRQITACFGKPISVEQRDDFVQDIKKIREDCRTDSQRLSLIMIEISLRIEASRKSK